MTQKILIVDDEPHIRFLIEQSLDELTEQGVHLLQAGDGVEALQVIENERPDLVLLDAMMPKMGGLEVCEKMRKELDMGDTYVVLVTARGQTSEKEKSLEAGINEFRTKPFDPDDLLDLAKKVLRRSPSAGVR